MGFSVGLSSHAWAENPWYPFPVEIPIKNETNTAVTKLAVDYTPVSGTEKPWKLCVSFPHMKDSYWLAVNFGVATEVKRLGARMRLFQAGGYDNLATQIRQIRECVASGTDGVIIGAISFDGLNDLVKEIRDAGIPVIDVINGMSSDVLSARSLVSFEEMGYRAGEYIAQRHPKGGPVAKIAWFPGPKDAGWVKVGDSGFKKAIANGSVELLATRYGDTGKRAQTALLEEVLEAHPDLDYIAGTAVTAAAAVKVLRLRGSQKQVKVVAYYFTPDVYRGIKRGHILAAPTDSAVIQGRIAVDQAIRILEGKPYHKQVGPKIYVIDQQNINSFDRSTSLAPSGFRATYSTNVRLNEE
ncbi:TMAO reductase system protein TorT [Motiliproteus sp. MSK22-1]|nr:TMAO reductase system protein TorT [Motiliproteus sp. MSK22-1]